MDEREIAQLNELVEIYVRAYDEEIAALPLGVAAIRGLWESRPLLREYQAVREFAANVPGSTRRYSAKTLETYVDALLSDALRDAGNIAHGAHDLIQTLSHDPLTTLYIPIDGVQIDASAYEIGALRLVNMDTVAFEALVVEPYVKVLRQNPRFSADAEQMADRLREELAPFIGRVCVEVTTQRDIDHTREFAEKTAIAAACDFLQFAASLFLAHDKNLKIQWAFQLAKLTRRAFAKSEGARPEIQRHFGSASPRHLFELTAGRLSEMKKYRFDRLADLVAQEARNEYDELLQRGVRWFAKGERDDHLDDRKLSYITVVDQFFSKRGSGATGRICKGFAFAMASVEGATVDQVPKWARLMLLAFDSRGATSHGGKLGVIDERELESLRWQVRGFLGAMCRLSLSSKDDVEAWVQAQEAALSDDLKIAVKDATDWRMVRDEAASQRIADVIRRFVFRGCFQDPDQARRAQIAARLLHDAVSNGGKFIHDLQPHLRALAEPTDTALAALNAGRVGAGVAAAYFSQVQEEFRSIQWIQEAL